MANLLSASDLRLLNSTLTDRSNLNSSIRQPSPSVFIYPFSHAKFFENSLSPLETSSMNITIAPTRKKPVLIHSTAAPNEIQIMMDGYGFTRIKAWRIYSGLTSAKVAQRLGISQSAYVAFEKRTNHRIGSIYKVAVALEIPPNKLLARQTSP